MSKVLVFGDSIALGLYQYLYQKSSHSIINAGVTGNHISEAQSRAKNYPNNDIVIVAISTNDYGVASIKSSYSNLISTLSSNNTNAKFYLCSSPGVIKGCSETYKHIDNEVIKSHNQEIKDCCSIVKGTYIDMYSLLGDQSKDSSSYRNPDGLHPNKAGYEKIASTLSLTSPTTDAHPQESVSTSIAFTWPVPSSSNITSGYGWRVIDGVEEFHNAIDIGAAYGAEIVAAADGVVNYYKPSTGYGNILRIDHASNLSTRYAHMAKSAVSAGQKVKKGQVIAWVASEGRSSGPHLHFEVYVGPDYYNDHRNPLDYVSPTGDTYVNADAVTQGGGGFSGNQEGGGFSREGDSSSGSQDLTNVAGTTVGQRVADITTQPIHAYISVFIGNDQTPLQELLSIRSNRPNTVKSFEYTRMQEAGERASIVLFDDFYWDEIEEIFSKKGNWDNIYIEYGYSGTGKKSKRIRFLVTAYSVNFDFTGVTLNFELVSQAAYDNMKFVTVDDMDTYNPTVAVKDICEKMGWKIGEFDESEDVTADDSFHLTTANPIQYIYDVIIPQAAAENEEIFYFYVDSDNVAYFKRNKFQGTDPNSLRTYIYQKGYDSTVIDLTFDIKGAFGGSSSYGLATTLSASVFDTGTKKEESYSYSNIDVITESPGNSVHTRPDQSNPSVDSSGYTPAQMSSRLYYRMKADIAKSYTATLTIVGDPTIKLMEYIRIINVTDAGYLHHTSGVYQIISITDSISDGSMTTVLKLVRNATLDIDGIEIINPKYRIR